MHIASDQNINEIHGKFSEYGRNAKKWQRKCGLLLGDIEKFEVWKKKGFSCIYEYAAKLAGMNKHQVDESLRIFRRIENKPALIAVAQKKGLYAVRPVATIATVETDKYWAEYALKMPKNELEIFVKNLENQNEIVNGISVNEGLFMNEAGQKSEMLVLNLKPEIILKLKKLCHSDWNEFMEKLIELFEENLNKELQVEKPKNITGASKHIPKNIEKYVLKRSNKKCEFPNCNKNYDHFHHVNRFSSNRVHDPDQIVALCKAHHGLAHRGLIDREEESPENWKIRKEPDYKNLNWFVDQKVQLYR